MLTPAPPAGETPAAAAGGRPPLAGEGDAILASHPQNIPACEARAIPAEIWGADQNVKGSQDESGVDGETNVTSETNRAANRYKIWNVGSYFWPSAKGWKYRNRRAAGPERSMCPRLLRGSRGRSPPGFRIKTVTDASYPGLN